MTNISVKFILNLVQEISHLKILLFLDFAQKRRICAISVESTMRNISVK